MANMDFGTFMDTLKVRLEARAGLSGVQVQTRPFNPDTEPLEGIQLESMNGSHEHFAMTPSMRDDATLTGKVWAQVTDAALEPGKASRDRAIVLIGELVTEVIDVNSQIYTTGAVNDVFLESWDYELLATDPPGWRAVIDFELAVIDLSV